MNWTTLSRHLSILVLCKCIRSVCAEPNNGQEDQRQIGCQQRSTLGRDYVGDANTTVDGIPCQRWSDTEPHDHDFTHVGDHNFCRNPDGHHSKLWCYTTDPEHRHQYCLVPFCPPLKALDFSLDNDRKRDENNSYTHASLQKENLPPSFTICTAFMVEDWANGNVDGLLFVLRDNRDKLWTWVKIFAAMTYTEFTFRFEDPSLISIKSPILFYPHQWTRVCLSKESNTSLTRLVVDGKLLVEKEVKVKSQPKNLNIVLGWSGTRVEFTGRTTDVNIFSSALSVEEMNSQTSPGKTECGPGTSESGFLKFEK